MTLRPPRSTRTDTLFPYTTLFRSWLISACCELIGRLSPLPRSWARKSDRIIAQLRRSRRSWPNFTFSSRKGPCMAALTVGIIDPFHPKTVEAIAAVLPQDWRLSVTTGPAPEERAAALSDAEVLFVMATRSEEHTSELQ